MNLLSWLHKNSWDISMKFSFRVYLCPTHNWFNYCCKRKSKVNPWSPQVIPNMYVVGNLAAFTKVFTIWEPSSLLIYFVSVWITLHNEGIRNAKPCYRKLTQNDFDQEVNSWTITYDNTFFSQNRFHFAFNNRQLLWKIAQSIVFCPIFRLFPQRKRKITTV